MEIETAMGMKIVGKSGKKKLESNENGNALENLGNMVA